MIRIPTQSFILEILNFQYKYCDNFQLNTSERKILNCIGGEKEVSSNVGHIYSTSTGSPLGLLRATTKTASTRRPPSRIFSQGGDQLGVWSPESTRAQSPGWKKAG
jgi:hypothetical protein